MKSLSRGDASTATRVRRAFLSPRRASWARAARGLRSDVSALSELAILLILVLAIIVVIALVAGGITIVLALFFGGRFGIALFFFLLAGAAFVAAYLVKPFAKLGLWSSVALGAGGVIFLVLGALGR